MYTFGNNQMINCTYVFIQTLLFFFCQQKVDLGAVMQKALIENKVEFVQLFLDSGVKLSKFLTVGRLEDLYQGVSLCCT
jgi:hypothetical protein